MSNLKPLVWFDGGDTYGGDDLHADSPLHYYVVEKDTLDGFTVRYAPNHGAAKYATGFASVDEAKQWAWNHYNEKMQPYVKPDAITDIANWFKAAKPEPTNKDKLVQIGCHYEEVAEMMVAVIGDDHMGSHAINNCANGFKSVRDELVDLMQPSAPLELLDALCDQIVTATGVGYMMGFDIEGALKEVIRSNNSKFENGKPLFNEQGKIMKGKDYSKPDLTPFVKESDCE